MSILETEPFVAISKYDNRIIDVSDEKDVDAKVNFLVYEPRMKLLRAQSQPINEAELAVYTLLLKSEEEIQKGTILELIFSEHFEPFITEPTKELIC